VERQEQVNVPVVKRFVREVVGCTCPDEVFKRVEVQRGSSALRSCAADYELRVGGRLLIVESSEASLSPARLERVMAEDRSARDAERFNRFRFIVQADSAAEIGKKLQGVFEGLAAKDEKTHLHVIGREDVPDFFGGEGR
jgi:hypothetical protein